MATVSVFKDLQSLSGLNNIKLAEYLGVHTKTIERWRADGCPKVSVMRDLRNLIKTGQ